MVRLVHRVGLGVEFDLPILPYPLNALDGLHSHVEDQEAVNRVPSETLFTENPELNQTVTEYYFLKTRYDTERVECRED